MARHYYLSLFPAEALIASEREPEDFGAYMALGARRGSAERLIFAEIDGEFGDDFDWDYAKEKCVQRPDGNPKNSLYLAVYRVLERVPTDRIKAIYLTTRDGRSLKLDPKPYASPDGTNGYYVYQELCPITPLVVTEHAPDAFFARLTDKQNKVYVPKLMLADLKTINVDNPEETGHLGSLYDRNVRHLKFCIDSVVSTDKVSKTINRSHAESFSFQVIGSGLYIGDADGIVMFPMPTVEELKQTNYDWALSALII